MAAIGLCPISSYSYSWKEFWRELASPVTTDAKVYTYTGSATALTLGVFFRDSVIEDVQNHFADRELSGDGLKYADLYGRAYATNIPYTLIQLGIWYWGDDELAYKRAEHMIKATAYSGLVTRVMKAAIRAPRPDSTTNFNSFPSGHTATAFSFASVIGVEHEWYWAVPAYLAATYAGIARIEENAHYLHDVIAGATIGIAYGIGLHRLNFTNESDGTELTFAPTPYGMQMVYSF